MDYEKALQILSNTNQNGYEEFLTLNVEQLGELIQYLSEEDETKIFAYLKKNNHVPLMPNSQTKPPFVDSIKSLYKRLYFPEKTKEKQTMQVPEAANQQNNQIKWFSHIFEPENQKQKAKETKFNFPYFLVVKRLLIAHNTQPLEQSVKNLHLQLEIIMRKIFSSKMIEGLRRLLGINRQMYVMPREQTKKNLTANHIKIYLSKLFQKQYSHFKEFKDQYEKIKKDVEVQPSQNESQSDEALQIQTSKQLYTIGDTDQQTQYYLLKTQTLSNQELVQFYRARETNFLKEGSQKIITFTKLNGVIQNTKNKQLLELLSYILCMTAKKIIFTKVRQINQGKLLPTNQKILPEEIQQIGNQYIQQIEKKAKSYCLKYESFIKKAFDCFKQQFYTEGYDLVFLSDTKIKLIKSQQDILAQNQDDKVSDVWKRNKELRKSWYERMVAESQVRHLDQESSEFKPVNSYAQHLFTNREKFKSLPNSKVFKAFMFKQPISQPSSKVTKRLESLF